jgi:hypothetical protein
MGILDTVYTFRFLKILSTKWENTKAYKLGIVDKDGEPLKKSSELMSNEEKDAYTPFIRLIFKLKRLMGKIPGGKSAVARYGAAIALIKEHEEEVLSMGIDLKTLEEGLKQYIGEQLNEECDGGGPTNKVGGIASKDIPLGQGKMQKRKKPPTPEEIVDDDQDEELDEDTPSYSYQLIGDMLIRVDEAQSRKRVIKKRIVAGKRQKKREYKSGKGSRFTRTGNRKLRGGALAKKRRALRKAKRKAHTGAANAKRKRSMKKSRIYN